MFELATLYAESCCVVLVSEKGTLIPKACIYPDLSEIVPLCDTCSKDRLFN